jgi:hypothetical protein
MLCKKEKLAHSQSKSADGQLVVKNFNKVKTKSCHCQLKVIESHQRLRKKLNGLSSEVGCSEDIEGKGNGDGGGEGKHKEGKYGEG